MKLPERLELMDHDLGDGTLYFGLPSEECSARQTPPEQVQCVLDWNADGLLIGIEIILCPGEVKR